MKKKEFLAGTVLLAASSALCLRLMKKVGERLKKQQEKAKQAQAAAEKAEAQAVAENGFLGAFTGGITAAAGGIAAAIFFGYLVALIFKPRPKG